MTLLRSTGWALAALMIPAGALPAAEIASNGLGGGAWSDPATWKGNAVPRADDEVTVRRGDTVVFDRDDDGKTTCHKLYIDPQGALRFKTGVGKVVFVASGPVESFGLIKLDGSTSADDFHELRLTGAKPDERSVKFDKGGALIASGRANLPGGKRNVRIASKGPRPADPKTTVDPMGKVEALAGAALDVRLVEFEDMLLSGKDIDNTGARPNERLNVIGNHFVGKCNLSLIGCDTPVVTDNRMEYPGGPWHQPAALALNGCPLAEVKNNTIKGMFYHALSLYGCTDAVVAGNTTEKAYVGCYCVGTAMFKNNTYREAGVGYVVTSMSGTMEGDVFEKVGAGIHLAGATVQMTDCVYRDPPTKEGRAIDFSAGEMTLVNCNWGPTSLTLPKAVNADKPLISAMHYLVLKVNGPVEEDTVVEVKTANAPPPAPGAADLNVRNSPAPLVGNRTPLPQTLSPLILKAWTIDKTGKTVPAPEYAVRVLGPTDGVKERKVLKTLMVKPQESWFRPRPNDPAPTVEVSVP